MGVDRVVCVELHAGQIEGFFGGNVAVDDLDSTTTFVQHLPHLLGAHFPNSLDNSTSTNNTGIVVVSPDAGGVARAKRFRTKCESLHGATPGWEPTSLAIIVKQRFKPNSVGSMDLVGEVRGRVCVLIDDMCDTAGTLLRAAEMLRESGAVAVFACIAHGVLSGPACDRLKKDQSLTRLCVLDTIGTVHRCRELCPEKIDVVR
jgi:ribose-phosphate pyrophosphokinase